MCVAQFPCRIFLVSWGASSSHSLFIVSCSWKISFFRAPWSHCFRWKSTRSFRWKTRKSDSLPNHELVKARTSEKLWLGVSNTAVEPQHSEAKANRIARPRLLSSLLRANNFSDIAGCFLNSQEYFKRAYNYLNASPNRLNTSDITGLWLSTDDDIVFEEVSPSLLWYHLKSKCPARCPLCCA